MKIHGLLHDKAGQRYGDWEVIGLAPKSGPGRYWFCRCSCGAEKLVSACSLSNGKSKSCGHERRTRWLGKPSMNRTHGMSNSPIYSIWAGIKQRCLDEDCSSYKDYGGRGIKLHPPWAASVQEFAAGVFAEIGERPSSFHQLDREDNDGNYEPGNIRWALPAVNCRNTRKSRRIEAWGRVQTLAQWGQETGLSNGTIRSRLERGEPPEAALSRPLRHQGARSDRRALIASLKGVLGSLSARSRVTVTIDTDGPLIKSHKIEVVET